MSSAHSYNSSALASQSLHTCTSCMSTKQSTYYNYLHRPQTMVCLSTAEQMHLLEPNKTWSQKHSCSNHAFKTKIMPRPPEETQAPLYPRDTEQLPDCFTHYKNNSYYSRHYICVFHLVGGELSMFKYNTYTHVYIHIFACTSILSQQLHTYMHTSTYIYLHTYLNLPTYIHEYLHLPTYIYAHI